MLISDEFEAQFRRTFADAGHYSTDTARPLRVQSSPASADLNLSANVLGGKRFPGWHFDWPLSQQRMPPVISRLHNNRMGSPKLGSPTRQRWPYKSVIIAT